MSDARDQIKSMVRQELAAAMNQQSSAPKTRIIDIAPKENAAPAPAQTVIDESIKTVITEDDLRRVPDGSQIRIAPNAVVTPLARDMAEQRHIKFDRARKHRPQSQRPVAIGSDHGGFEMKELLKRYLEDLGYAYNDFGTYGSNAVDYPDFAHSVARAVASGQYGRGIVIDGAGIGSCMAANKVPGVRAAMCYDKATAKNSREHNDANVLTLGGKMIDEARMREIVKTFLETDCTEERHKARVAKIDLIERQYLR
jgi:ribose 5-phosphate isomerase B